MRRYIRNLFCLFAAVALVLGGAVSHAEEEGTDAVRIISCALSEDGKKLVCDAQLSAEFLSECGAGGIFLFELAPYEGDGLDQKAPSAELVASRKLSFTVDFTAGGKMRKYNRIVLARQKGDRYETIAGPVYITNPDRLASNRAELTAAGDLAGVVATSESAVASEHVPGYGVVRVCLAQLLSDSAEGTARLEGDGQEYYIDKERLLSIDNQVRELSENGSCVYLQFVLTAADDKTAAAARPLYAQGSGSVYQAFSFDSRASVSVYCALVEYLAQRYTRDDRAYGFAGRFIFGDAVNAPGHYGKAVGTDEFSAELERALRITSTALRSSYAGAQLDLSLDGAYTVGDLPTKEVLSALGSSAADLPFGVMVRACAPDGARADFWNEERADGTANTQYITMKNISVLTELLKTPGMLCTGRVRTLSAQFCADATHGQSLQAASVLCAYYEAKTSGLVSLIYDPLDDSDTGLYSDGVANQACEVFFGARELSDDALTAKIKELLGDEQYYALSEGAFSELLISRTRMDAVQGELPDEARAVYIADFVDGSLYNFTADAHTASAQSIILDREGIVLCLTGNADRAGAIRTFNDYETTGDLIILNLMADTDGRAQLTLTLSGLCNGMPVMLYGDAELVGGEWTRVAFPIDGIDTLQSLSFSAASQTQEPLTLYAKNITTYQTAGSASDLAVRVILWVLAFAVALCLGLYCYLVFIRRRKPVPPAPPAQPERRGARYTYKSGAGRAPRAIAPNKAGEPKAPSVVSTPPKQERRIPEMPKTASKTFVVPAKPIVAPDRATLSLGITVNEIKTETADAGGFDTTAGTQASKQIDE